MDDGSDNISIHGQQQNGENTVPETCSTVKSHLSNFLPTSRRIVQFSNGKVWLLDFSI